MPQKCSLFFLPQAFCCEGSPLRHGPPPVQVLSRVICPLAALQSPADQAPHSAQTPTIRKNGSNKRRTIYVTGSSCNYVLFGLILAYFLSLSISCPVILCDLGML